MSKIIENKKQKKNAIFSSAYELFTTKGFDKTAINDIVKKAGVAKGTFYLYFRDKNQILDNIILKKSSVIIKEAFQETMNKEHKNFIDAIIFFTNYTIEYLKDNIILLSLIYKNLSWGLYRKALSDPELIKDMDEIYRTFLGKLKDHNISVEDVDKTLFLIIELVGSTCYSSIILKEPASIDEMKPILFKVIRKMLE
ncbi:TetR/AcrR family transcriptional regulator [Vallitalea sp.]|jgi:AcrR family transcriptional regulator|uniref:TetR/AcrR family transcriptional regulator n=1 Tax=Vallitalea sp. TaxID=1882829 RepID=UPI0025F7FB8E|nr:TetR/AcrR family transcriptional regulator [Vallitalea sp.]MCT4688581.1 TetR/AcrR family transcriptional regulator [Vallitalea sp.]